AQFARYFGIHVEKENTPGTSDGTNDVVRAAGRILFTGSLAENPKRDLRTQGVQRRTFDPEYGVEIDSYTRLRNFATTGSLVWTHHITDSGSYANRVTYFYRGPELSLLNDYVRFSGRFGVGGEHTDAWHWGATRAILNAAVDLPHVHGRAIGT